MFARGVVSLHTPPLLGRKPSSVKSRVSITSKLIEIKGLQLQHFGHLRKTGGRGSYGHPTKDVHPEPAEGLFSYSALSFWPTKTTPATTKMTVLSSMRIAKGLQPKSSRHEPSPLPATSANLCGRRPPRPGRGASALGSLFPRSSLSAVDCRLSAISSPLTPVFPPLARPILNSHIFNIFPTTGGRVPPLVRPMPSSTPGTPFSRMALRVFSDLPIWRLAFPGSDEANRHIPSLHTGDEPRATGSLSASPPVTIHQSPVTLLAPLRSSPLGAKITTLLERETFGRPTVSNTQSGQRLGHTVRTPAQPSSASKPRFLLRRWGRKADRVRLGQRTLVG
jgi:hypothetical protein